MIRSLARIASLLCLCAAAHAQSSIQVLDFGATPRVPIRYRFHAGASEHAVMEMSMTSSREENGKVTSMSSPSTRTTMSIQVTDVAADGSAHVEFATRSVEATGPAGASDTQTVGDKTLADSSKLSGSYRTDTRGHITSWDISLPKGDLQQAVSKLMDSMAADDNDTLQEFPEEAVGPGAHWQVVSHRKLGGQFKVDMTQDFTLRSRVGNVIVLDTKTLIEMAAVSPGPGIPDFNPQSGSGTQIIDLDKLVPTSTSESSSSQTIPKGPTQAMKMHSKMVMKTFPATPADSVH